ncbi:hypothetical protein [Flavihumibacter petaseus]|uniref:Lipocalin-like domain-containing protein n=1 Tax=Flavihumibacter petaseus NBRC 106054 TaxID=1220578 RepID=A0A0E9MYW0_9BACT|nr:hypothetical protein [Flavihumibacter petaseus]GAO42718.1 hypothetical protein FPE01S_01_17350 [Flavihumibacter petaseus NBRC 106054]
MKKSFIAAFIFCSLLSSASCGHPAEVNITGNWRLDSIYDYYNGFSFTNKNPSPQEVYEYRDNNTVLRKGMGEQLEYRYHRNDSILSLSDQTGRPADEFVILHVDDNLMALKKNKSPLFGGKNQRRYEVRYFSRVQ